MVFFIVENLVVFIKIFNFAIAKKEITGFSLAKFLYFYRFVFIWKN